MKVILKTDVPNLGDAGEIKNVANGYARNYLIPRQLVIPANEGSARALEHQRRIMELRTEKRNKEMTEVAKSLEALGSVEIPVRVGARNKLYGSVTTHHIAQAIQEKGFSVEKRKVELSENIKALGAVKIKIRLAEKIIIPFTINVVPDADSVLEEEEAPMEAATEESTAQAEEATMEESGVEEATAAAEESTGETSTEA